MCDDGCREGGGGGGGFGKGALSDFVESRNVRLQAESREELFPSLFLLRSVFAVLFRILLKYHLLNT